MKLLLDKALDELETEMLDELVEEKASSARGVKVPSL